MGRLGWGHFGLCLFWVIGVMIVSTRTAFIYLFLTTTFWAGNAIVGRAFFEELPPFQLAFWRWTLAALLVLIIMRPPLRASFPIFWKHKFLIFWAATFGIGMFNTLQYASLNYTSATNVGLLQVALPVFIAAVDRAIYKTPVSVMQISGMIFATIGVFVVLTKGSLEQLYTLQFNLGDILMLTAIGVYSIFSVLIKALPKLDQWTFLFVIFVIGALQLLPFLFYELAFDRQLQVTSETVWVIAYIVIGPAFLAYKFYTSSVSTLGPNKAGMFFYWIPIATAIMATIFLKESLHLFHFVGFCLVGIGLRLGLSEKKQPAESAS